ncbi:cell division protein FtsL [Aestuariibius insulae]|uniref:cell division protein FtsL n=1 Tax=Aestuariibius insulae TaxID=2058287 RepID=UPI00345E8921
MRSFLFMLSALAIVGLAFWAYRENYATQQSLREVRDLHDQIGAAHARLTVLNAEWAYLNRPDRLRDLVELNYERLGLLPLTPETFGRLEQVAYPQPDLGPILETVETSSAGEDRP